VTVSEPLKSHFIEKTHPFHLFIITPPKITKTHIVARFVATLRKHPRKGWLVAHSFFSCFRRILDKDERATKST
jgi:hypothetical protein